MTSNSGKKKVKLGSWESVWMYVKSPKGRKALRFKIRVEVLTKRVKSFEPKVDVEFY